MMETHFNGKNLKTHLYTFENGEHLKPVSKMKTYLDVQFVTHAIVSLKVCTSFKRIS